MASNADVTENAALSAQQCVDQAASAYASYLEVDPKKEVSKAKKLRSL